MNRYQELQVPGFERVVRCDNADVGLTAWIAVHNTTLGPALGGCRLWPYVSEEDALADVLRLSEGMTYKNSLADLPLGGGKAVIQCDPTGVGRRPLFLSFGEAVDYLEGTYITAEDVNSTLADMGIIKRRTPYVATVGASGNPSPFTAYGVFCGIKACCGHLYGNDDLAGKVVAIQGVGQTGSRLAQLLANEGCRIVAADINEKNIRLLKEKLSFEQAGPEEILSLSCDIFSPCALGGVLNRDSIKNLRCRIVAGSANNQLDDEQDGEKIRQRGILYAPDFAINAGGVINISCEFGRSYDATLAKKKTETIGPCLKHIFLLAEAEKLPTSTIACRLAKKNIARAKRYLKTG